MTSLHAATAVHAEASMALTRETGLLARGASMLRGQGTVGARMLPFVAQNLGVSFPELEGVLIPKYEALGWVVAKREGRRIATIQDQVPRVATSLSDLGGLWKEGAPTAHDDGSVNGLHLLSERPLTIQDFQSRMGLSAADCKEVVDFGVDATYFDEVQGRLWSPLFWQADEGKVVGILNKHEGSGYERIGALVKTLKTLPGGPDSSFSAPAGLVNDLARAGVIPNVRVGPPDNNYRYLFPPQGSFSGNLDSDLFEKSRKIVACLRHGQFHGRVTKIRSPRAVLRTIRDGTFSGHSYGIEQYMPLKTEGIANITPVTRWGKEMFKIALVDTEENRKAVQLAELLLRDSTGAVADISDPEILLSFGEGIVEGQARERVRLRQSRVQRTQELEMFRKALVGGIE